MKVAISGTAGSGKSTVAKMLAKKLGYRHYSMGDFQREIAKEKGLTIVELGELEKKDPSIDKMVDDRQKRLGIEKDDFVIDAWLAPYFIPDSFKVYMDADIKERAKRITKKREAEAYHDPADAVKAIAKRETTNRDRWIKFYGYDFMDRKNYDLFIDTTGKSVENVTDIILKKLGK